MPINMYCPNGHQLVTENQYAGRKVRCPHCQSVVIVPGAPETAVTAIPVPAAPPRRERNEIDEGDVLTDDEVLGDEDIILEEDDRPRRKRRREYEDEYEEEVRPRRSKKLKRALTRQQMAMTNLGLAFHYAKILAVLIGIAVMALANILLVMSAGAAATSTPGTGSGGAGALAVAGLIATLAQVVVLFGVPLLGITGSTLCCWVPSKTGGKPLIITSLALDGAGLLLPFVAIAVVGAGAALRGVGGGAGALGLVLILLSPLCSLAGFILFMLFLRQLADFFGEHGAADESMSIIVNFLILVIGVPIGIVVLLVIGGLIAGKDRASATFVGCTFGLLMIAIVIAWFVFLIKLLFRILNLLGTLRQVVRSQYRV